MTGAAIFIDSNVIAYTFDRNAPDKAAIAKTALHKLFAAGRPVVSVQVLSELFWTLTRKQHLRMNPAEAAAEVRRMQGVCRVTPLELDLLNEAIDVSLAHQFAIWDAQIVTAARQAGCRIVLSEDMQDGQQISGVTVRNPFAASFCLEDYLVPANGIA